MRTHELTSRTNFYTEIDRPLVFGHRHTTFLLLYISILIDRLIAGRVRCMVLRAFAQASFHWGTIRPDIPDSHGRSRNPKLQHHVLLHYITQQTRNTSAPVTTSTGGNNIIVTNLGRLNLNHLQFLVLGRFH